MKGLEEIRPLIEEKLAETGLELYDISFARAGRNSVLKVFVDKEGGVTIDECETASREISTLLDVEEFSTSTYRLEVSSPGADRPLRTERDFKRARGREVRFMIDSQEGRQKNIRGTVLDCTAGSVRIETAGGEEDIDISRIITAKIEFSFK
jgi:ribosome maturation factor RimP